jgi:hypothetical protein
MADISVRGFVSKPATKEGAKGKFATFTLSEGVKQKDGSYKNFFYNITNFHSETPPEDGARVEVKGWLKLREWGDAKKLSLDVAADEVAELAPPKEGRKASPAAEADPWDAE